MSRSYRKTPRWGMRNERGMKKIANHRVRRLLKDPEISLSRNDYRKVFCSWNICDFKGTDHRTFEQYYQDQVNKWREYWNQGYYWYADKEDPPSKDEFWKEWLLRYCNK